MVRWYWRGPRFHLLAGSINGTLCACIAGSLFASAADRNSDEGPEPGSPVRSQSSVSIPSQVPIQSSTAQSTSGTKSSKARRKPKWQEDEKWRPKNLPGKPNTGDEGVKPYAGGIDYGRMKTVANRYNEKGITHDLDVIVNHLTPRAQSAAYLSDMYVSHINALHDGIGHFQGSVNKFRTGAADLGLDAWRRINTTLNYGHYEAEKAAEVVSNLLANAVPRGKSPEIAATMGELANAGTSRSTGVTRRQQPRAITNGGGSSEIAATMGALASANAGTSRSTGVSRGQEPRAITNQSRVPPEESRLVVRVNSGPRRQYRT